MKYIAYYRVSTLRQGKSGLGLEAQRFSVEKYVESQGGEIVKEFQDIETAGTKDVISVKNRLDLKTLLTKRPSLLKAINMAVTNGYTIVVKEYSRLTRFSLLIDYLLATGVKFVCADSPNDEALIIKLKVAIFEEEWLNIGRKIKAACDAKKRRGHTLWFPKGNNKEKRKKTMRLRADDIRDRREFKMSLHDDYRKAHFLHMIMREQGMTYKEILKKIEDMGLRTEKGCIIRQCTMTRILQNSFITGEM